MGDETGTDINTVQNIFMQFLGIVLRYQKSWPNLFTSGWENRGPEVKRPDHGHIQNPASPGPWGPSRFIFQSSWIMIEAPQNECVVAQTWAPCFRALHFPPLTESTSPHL